MAGQCDFLEKGPCGGFRKPAGGFRLDDLHMGQDDFDFLVTELNSKLRAPHSIGCPASKTDGSWWQADHGVAHVGIMAALAIHPLILGVAVAASAVRYAVSPDAQDEQHRYEEQQTAAYADMEQFFRIVFVGPFRDCGFAVDLDNGCEHVSSSFRLTFRRVHPERVVADQGADAPDASHGLSPRRHAGQRQRSKTKKFWKGARAFTPRPSTRPDSGTRRFGAGLC